MKFIRAFFMSLGMFSVIPCPRVWDEKARPLMLAFLPLVGLVIGLIWYGLYLLTRMTQVPLPLKAALLMLYPYLITGFIHLDGFMDTSDALLSRRTLEEKLRILKDPHTGAFAVISVAVLFILCYAAMTAVMEKVSMDSIQYAAPERAMAVLIFIPVITRCCSSIAVLAGKPLAHSQYRTEEGTKKPAAEIAVLCIMGLAAGLAAPAAAAGFGASGAETPALQGAAVSIVLMVLAMTLASYLVAILGAARQLNGVSGDLAGYALIVGEGVAVVTLAVML